MHLIANIHTNTHAHRNTHAQKNMQTHVILCAIPCAYVTRRYDPYVGSMSSLYQGLKACKHSEVRMVLGPWTHGDHALTYAGGYARTHTHTHTHIHTHTHTGESPVCMLCKADCVSIESLQVRGLYVACVCVCVCMCVCACVCVYRRG